jgi:hypothetical protein
MTAALPATRPALVRRSRRLNYATLAYNSPEGIVSIGAGLLAGSIVLVGFGADSGALAAEAKQTLIGTYLSAILLLRLGLNALWDWWWADPVAGPAMVPLIAREGIDGIRGRSACEENCRPLSSGVA